LSGRGLRSGGEGHGIGVVHVGTFMLDDVRMAVRLARDFRAFLGRPYGTEDCHRLLEDQFARRDEPFLRIMARAVFGNARSPYLALMHQAKVRYSDVAAWVRRPGVEGALAALFEAGVYVELGEFKGRRPIRPRWTAPARRLEAPV
jgi:hypothetical protein